MIYSANKIVGALVFRTREALNANTAFISALSGYPYFNNCLFGGAFHLWHYPGTHNEISNVLGSIRGENAAKVKFPAILNFQQIRERVDGDTVNDKTITLNLAISGLVHSEWLTEDRDRFFFELLVYPIYEEFIRQVRLSGFFQMPYSVPPHDAYNVYTTGEKGKALSDRYGDFIDAREIHGLSLRLRSGFCDRDYLKIVEQDFKVTENILNILKT